MASAAPRFHIVLPVEEKNRWAGRAAAAGLSTAEYVRRAVAAYEDEERLTPDQLAELEAAADEARAAAERIRAMVDEVVAAARRPLDEAAMRDRATARLAAEPVELDPVLLDFGADGPCR